MIDREALEEIKGRAALLESYREVWQIGDDDDALAASEFVMENLGATLSDIAQLIERERELWKENERLRGCNEEWQSLEVIRQMTEEKYEDVLYAFAMEQSPDAETLKNYLQKHPTASSQLGSLFAEILLMEIEQKAEDARKELGATHEG